MTLIAKLATPDTKDKWLGYYTSLWGVGSMTGPLLGSALYSVLSFELMFYLYGGLEILLALVVRYKVKNSPIPTEESNQKEDLLSKASN